MTRSRLRLVLEFLLSGAAAAALVPLPACRPECPDEVTEPEPLALPEDVEVLGEHWDPNNGDQYLVGAGGVVLELFGARRVSRPVDVDLRAVTASAELVIVAGAGGVVAAAPRGGDDWQIVDLGTTASLWGAAHVSPSYDAADPRARVLLVGDGVMFIHEPFAGRWAPVPAPEGGWGDLRAVHGDWQGHVLAVGRAGVIWSATSPEGPWTREDAGTDADLTAVHDGLVGGVGGLVLARDEAGVWRRRPIDSTSTVLDVSPAILTAAGEIFEIDYDGTVSTTPLTDPVPGARVLIPDAEGSYAVLGAPGSHRQVGAYCYSYEGRPFVVADAPRLASLVARADWCAEAPAAAAPAAIRDALAAAWTAAALAEHASVASFARAVLELMSLGAPPELLLATQAAIADEVAHASLAFAQVRRHGGVARGPGPLAIADSLGRAGDPVAIALAVLVEGCVGEGVAAAEAAVAADGCEEPELREVLRRIAADEASHAALAWRTLRWLIDRFGETVAAPLRRRVATLEPPPPRAPAGPDLRAHGHLPAAERAKIHRAVVREVVRPLADALLAAPAAQIGART